jgi:fructose PTS system EIIB component
MKLVAITSCPTGIAHSQMAAENLQTTAEQMGHDISVEVQGAMGAQDELTPEEIEAAEVVIITADTAVSRDRFDGKPVMKGTVKDAVNDAESVIRDAVALAESGTVEEAEPRADDTEETEPDTAPEREEKQLGGDPSKGLFARLKRLFN